MKKILKKIMPVNLFFFKRKWQLKKSWAKEMAAWEASDKGGNPPHPIKQAMILERKKKYNLNILVETGTYYGDMVEAQRKNFSEIHTIELSPALYKLVWKRFKRFKYIHCYLGDSGKILKDIVSKLDEPALFWLDGHYSGGITAKGETECPIFEELEAILNSDKKHIILIDDARCFVGQGDYPTLKKLTDYIKGKDNRYKLAVKNDIICLDTD